MDLAKAAISDGVAARHKRGAATVAPTAPTPTAARGCPRYTRTMLKGNVPTDSEKRLRQVFKRGNCSSDALRTLMTLLLAQTREPAHIPTPPSLSTIPGAEWGLWGAIAFLSVREIFKWFHNKEDSETKLLHSLIDSLQSNQAQLLKQLVETQNNTNQAINGLKSAVEALGQQIKMETAQIARSNHHSIRQVNDRLDRLDSCTTIIDDDGDSTTVPRKNGR